LIKDVPIIETSLEKLKLNEERFKALIAEALSANINYEEDFGTSEVEFLN
jgi:hypothetical protein